jgi:hypothetical protein
VLVDVDAQTHAETQKQQDYAKILFHFPKYGTQTMSVWAALSRLRIKNFSGNGNEPSGSTKGGDRISYCSRWNIRYGLSWCICYDIPVSFHMGLAPHSSVCRTHILVITTQAGLLSEKHLSCRFVFTEVYINKLGTFPFLPFRYIYISFFNITKRFCNPCRKKKITCSTDRWASCDT